MDIFKNEGGVYARTAAALLAEMAYQTRTGVLTAGHYGVAQIRQRVIVWGAASGREQLPPFPAPTHRCVWHHAVRALWGACLRFKGVFCDGNLW